MIDLRRTPPTYSPPLGFTKRLPLRLYVQPDDSPFDFDWALELATTSYKAKYWEIWKEGRMVARGSLW